MSYINQPELLSFAKEGATFSFNFNTKSKPIRLKCALYDMFAWIRIVIKVNEKTYNIDCISLADFKLKVSANAELTAQVTVTSDDSFFYVTANSLAVKTLYLANGVYFFESKLDSNLSSQVSLLINDILKSTLTVAEIDGVYTADVSGLLPQATPELPSISKVVNYPYKYQLAASLDNAASEPYSNACYGWSVVRPGNVRLPQNYENTLNNLDNLAVSVGQRIFVHYLADNSGATYSIEQTIVKQDGTRITSSVGSVASEPYKVISFVANMPVYECVVGMQIKKAGIAVGSSLTYYVMPAAENQRYMYIKNLFGLYESLLILTPASYSYDFDSDQILLANGAKSVKNSSIEPACELSVDMLTDINSKMLGAMLSAHGQFLLHDNEVVNTCTLLSKSVDAVNESESLQSIKLKFCVNDIN